jgi:hypothetical protein
MILNYELERVWKEALVVYFNIISLNFPGGTEENHKESHSGYPVSRLKFKPMTY